MGLHLNWELCLSGSWTEAAVDAVLLELRDFACERPFEEVSRLVAGGGDRRRSWVTTLDTWARIIAKPYDEDAPPLYGDPGTARAFFVNAGRGCETASFGFLKRADGEGGHAEWFWHCVCKTQYASVVSDEHLIACHTGLVAVLDRASELGIGVVVRDETHYWETRDISILVNEVHEMNRIVARIAGAMSDAFEGHGEHALQAPIFEHRRFEQLEMGEDG